MNDAPTIHRMFMGDFLAPADMPMAGQRIVVCSFLVRHEDALILVDTGIAPVLPPEDEELYRFHRRPILDALTDVGVEPDSIDLVVNCHLHADHAGGNRDFRGRPIYVQTAELEAARQPDYSVPEALDIDGGGYVVVNGERELAPGIRVVPTPGHSPGHQAVVVDRPEGPTVLAGQGYRSASDFAMAIRACELERQGEKSPPYADWVPRILALDPMRVVFAHDYAIWQRGA